MCRRRVALERLAEYEPHGNQRSEVAPTAQERNPPTPRGYRRTRNVSGLKPDHAQNWQRLDAGGRPFIFSPGKVDAARQTREGLPGGALDDEILRNRVIIPAQCCLIRKGVTLPVTWG